MYGTYHSDNISDNLPGHVIKFLLNQDLLMVVARGDLGKVRELLDKGADVNTRDEFGVYPAPLRCYK